METKYETQLAPGEPEGLIKPSKFDDEYMGYPTELLKKELTEKMNMVYNHFGVYKEKADRLIKEKIKNLRGTHKEKIVVGGCEMFGCMVPAMISTSDEKEVIRNNMSYFYEKASVIELFITEDDIQVIFHSFDCYIPENSHNAGDGEYGNNYYSTVNLDEIQGKYREI